MRLLPSLTICALYKSRWEVEQFFRQLNLELPLYTFLQILSAAAFEKMPLQQAFAESDYSMNAELDCNQSNLFVH